MNDFCYTGQVSYYHDIPEQIEIEVKLIYPDYKIYVNGQKVKYIPFDKFEIEKVLKIPYDFPGRVEYYMVWSETDDEVFIMRKCDGKRYYKRTVVLEEDANEIRQIAKTEVVEEQV